MLRKRFFLHLRDVFQSFSCCLFHDFDSQKKVEQEEPAVATPAIFFRTIELN